MRHLDVVDATTLRVQDSLYSSKQSSTELKKMKKLNLDDLNPEKKVF